MIINHNSMASNALRQLNINSGNQAKSMAKLSSGLRINTAADDAAGLAISEKMKGQIRGLDQASRNAQDGQSLVQTAEGALSQTTDILQRMRELAVQGANDTATNDDRTQIQKETNQLTDEIDRIASTTQFNTKNLLDGSLAGNITAQGSVQQGTASLVNSNVASSVVAGVSGVAANAQVGTHVINLSKGVAGQLTSSMSVSATQTLASLGVQNLSTLKVGDNGSTVAFGSTLTTNSTVQDFINAVNTSGAATASIDQNGKLNIVSKTTTGTQLNLTDATASGDVASVLFGGTDTAGTTTAASTNASSTEYTVTDTFTPTGSSTSATTVDRSGYTPTASTPLTLGTGSNANGIIINVGTGNLAATQTLTVNTVAAQNAVGAHTDSSLTFQIGANSNQSMKVDINNMSSQGLNIKIGSTYQDVSTQAGAENAITVFDNAIKQVSTERAKLGAFSNRLDNTVNNLNTSSQNISDAQSRIADVDMAKEMMNQSKSSVLAQAAQAMLAQANQQPQQVLQLLRG